MIRPDLPDLLAALGALLVLAGVGLWSVPAALVLAGLACGLLAWWLARARAAAPPASSSPRSL